MSEIIFSISSNSTDRQKKIHDGIEELRTLIPNLKYSEPFTSDCFDGNGLEYLTVAAKGETSFGIDRIEVFIKAFEWNIGRDRDNEKDGVVNIDIDIVACDGKILKPRDYKAPGFQKALKTI